MAELKPCPFCGNPSFTRLNVKNDNYELLRILLINIKNLPFHYPVLHYQKYLQITLENSRIFNQTLSCSQKRENTAFWKFRAKTLRIRYLLHLPTKLAVFERVFGLVKLQWRLRQASTEPLLGFNGGPVALQNGLKRSLKVPLLKANKR